MKRLILVGLAALAATALLVGPVQATDNDKCDGCYNGKQRGHTVTIEQGSCGCARVGVHARSRHGGDTATATIAGRSRSVTLSRGGHGYIFFTGLPAGSYHATVQVGGKTYTTGRVTVKECQEQSPPTTTTPPTTAPPDVITDPPGFHDTPAQGSSVSKKRTVKTPAAVPTPKLAPKPPVSAPTPDALPFTGPYDYLYPYAGGFLLVGLVLLIATRRRIA